MQQGNQTPQGMIHRFGVRKVFPTSGSGVTASLSDTVSDSSADSISDSLSASSAMVVPPGSENSTS